MKRIKLKLLFNRYCHQASSLANDVGLLRTILPIVFTANVQPVIFNPQTVGGGISVLIYGWGRTTATGGYSNTLLRQSFGTITNDVCRERFPYVVRGSIYDQNICTSLPTAATCPGSFLFSHFIQPNKFFYYVLKEMLADQFSCKKL